MVGIYPEEFVKAVTDLWGGSSVLTAKVPGGIWFDAAPEDADSTCYGRLKISPQDPKILASRNWIQQVDFAVELWSARAMDDTDRQAVIQAATQAFCGTGVELSMPSGQVSSGAAWPRGGAASLAENRRQGASVIQTVLNYRFQISGTF